MNNNQPASGVTGNTQPQLNAAAGPGATTTRTANLQKHKKTFALIAIAIAVITAIIVFTSENVQTGGLLLTGLIIFYVGGQFTKKPSMSWGSIVKIAGAAMIAIVLISTSFVQKPLEGINSLEESIASISNCPGTKPVGIGGRLVIQKGCSVSKITVPMSLDPWYKIEDGRFAGKFADWFTPTWDKHNGALVNIEHCVTKQGECVPTVWPEGVTKVEVKILTKEQWQAEQDAEVINAALSGATK